MPRPQGDTVNINGVPVERSAIRSDFGAINLGKLDYNGNIGRTLVWGSGDAAALAGNRVIGLGGSMQPGQPLLAVTVSQSPLPFMPGFSSAPDSPLQFDSVSIDPGRLSGTSIVRSDLAADKYHVTGANATVAIVDTGTDFSNPDMQGSLARDKNGVPIMLDADGQGIVLTQATYIAKIDNRTGRIQDAGYTPHSELPAGMTSYVYLNETGSVFLRTSHGEIPTYNSLYPYLATPTLNATARVDWRIGSSPDDYIRSQSGVYRFGLIYQAQSQLGTITFGLVPVLMVDSEKPGVYDTIIPDMSFAWYAYTRNELQRLADSDDIEHLFTEDTFDFTDETPIKIGDGNEFLVYDYDNDGFPDLSMGTAGARVVDVWQVIDDKTEPAIGDESGYGGLVVADLLEPIDPDGEYFGVMFDSQGHGTSTAATVASAGRQEFDIYDDGGKWKLAGIAPGAKIIPVKALWAGDSIYGWLYAAGFDPENGTWRYSGDHKADIISNSWGIAQFPLLQYGPGYDILSVFSSLLVVPGLIAPEYPGTVMVNSLGNNGLGYGSTGPPNISPFVISVGATTNNVHLKYDGFANVTRFGSSVEPYDEIADFSSRGPGLLGDPKPELMAIGEYAFTPTIVTGKNLQSTADDPNNDGAFALFGGTSMAAPMVAGAAALVIDDLRDQGKEVDPFTVKSILMSTAKDLKNDPFVQGSGRVDAFAAIELAKGKGGRFSAYTEDTVPNILSAMSNSIYTYDNTLGIIYGGLGIAERLESAQFRESRWFAGYIEQGGSSTTEIVIDNPAKKPVTVEASPVVEKLVARYELNNKTKLFEEDPDQKHREEIGYAPNYYNLDDIGGIPSDAELMVVRANFPFSSFMNSTELFGDYLSIASIYGYDWDDSNRDGKVSHSEIAMINRGGSWGTVQEMRISSPAEKFENTPVIGVYPVPSIFSFWSGDRQIKPVEMNYTLTVEFYKRDANPAITLDSAAVTAGPEGTAKLNATVTIDKDALPGIYYGSIKFTGGKGSDRHTVLMPVSYVVTTTPVPKDVPIVIAPSDGGEELGLRPNGYVGGLFDMISRYSAGDWRSYYFTVSDSSITSMTLKISWPHNSTSVNAVAYGPDGRQVASSVPAGVFQTFAGWPTNDWLGTSAFSEGGAFYFSQNSGDNSTLMHVPVNQTGVYSVLVHNTLFHGESLYEPLQVEARFSTILPDSAAPLISVAMPAFVSGREHVIPVTVVEEHPGSLEYVIDGLDPVSLRAGSFDVTLDGAKLGDGTHRLRIDSTDLVGHSTSFVSDFVVDSTPPAIDVFAQNSKVQDRIVIARDTVVSWNVTDANGVAPLSVAFLNATKEYGTSSMTINSTSLQEGIYQFSIAAKDVPGNNATKNIELVVDRTAPKAMVALQDGVNARGIAKVGLLAEDTYLKSAVLAIGDKKSVDVTGMEEYNLDTTELPDGEYELKLVATDMAGNMQVTSAQISVSNYFPQTLGAGLLGLAAGAGIATAVVWFYATNRRRAKAGSQ
jgi:hypothetical protein